MSEKEKTCDICGLEFKTGLEFKPYIYRYETTPIVHKRIMKKSRAKMLVCDQCCETFYALVRNYRRGKLEF